MTFKIGNKELRNFGKPFIVAEIGANHNGSLELAKKLIKKLKMASVDCAKFQFWSKQNLFSESMYENNTKLEKQLDSWAFGNTEMMEMKKYCDKNNIMFACTPISKENVDFLVDELHVDFVKVASMDINNHPFLRYIAKKEKPIILSTGTATLSEIDEAVLKQIHGNAATLHDAGLSFALSSGGNYEDFLENLRHAVGAGLDKEVALAKITREPAVILGLGEILGTAETGKIANLIMTDGDLFADSTKVKMVFIDGRKHEITEPERPAEETTQGIDGKWDATVFSPEGDYPLTMTLELSGTKVTGTVISDLGESSIMGGTFRDNSLSFTTDAGGMYVSFVGTLSGDSISGTVEVGDMGVMDWKAVRPKNEF